MDSMQPSEPQYKYKFKKWNIKKNIPSTKKKAMWDTYKERKKIGKSTKFIYEGKEVSTQKLSRWMKDKGKFPSPEPAVSPENGNSPLASGQMFAPSPALPSGSMFLDWNTPQMFLRSLNQGITSLPRSEHLPGTPMSDVIVATPSDISSPSAANNAPSPLSKTHDALQTTNRARMLAAGHYGDDLTSMDNEEQGIMSMWLYQYWVYAYKTAKSWGRGPREWNAETLGFNRQAQAIYSSQQRTLGWTPPSLCISVQHLEYDDSREPESPSVVTDEEEMEEDASFPALPDRQDTRNIWPSSWQKPPYETKILHGLASNSFSNIESNRLPVALPKIVQLAETAGGKFTDEALCFSIMAGNRTLVGEIARKRTGRKITGINPIHLAVSYLPGSTACCSILRFLLKESLGTTVDMDALGYTPFECLMVSIIRSHTSTPPQLVDARFDRFPGDEVDICGRWSADHSAVRDVLSDASGIPFEWKHKFCNTSLQTACHCLTRLFAWDISAEDDLCVDCWYLANNGTKNEDMFGIIALLLCMLKCGADPRLKASISISALTLQVRNPYASPTKCDHQHLSADELAALLPQYPAPMQGPKNSSNWSGATWSRSIMTGWLLLVAILKRAVVGLIGPTHVGVEYCSALHNNNFHLIYFGKSKLGVLWGAFQFEFLTYRRLKVQDPWRSDKVDMEKLLEDLLHGDGSYIESLKNGMRPMCECGSFLNVCIDGNTLFPVLSDVRL
ncbi:hypothetical protein K440DRAFT_662174 [Wilcoxina mikolae CBS 423.85]|nr:hypothetical protein K440DRAFT_662174 [Wilcoxina mikolae CBS 423.85]